MLARSLAYSLLSYFVGGENEQKAMVSSDFPRSRGLFSSPQDRGPIYRHPSSCHLSLCARPQKALQHTLRLGKHLCFTKRKTRGRLVFGCDTYAGADAVPVIYDLDKEAAILEPQKDDEEASVQAVRTAAGESGSAEKDTATCVSAQTDAAGTEQWRLANVAGILLMMAADQAEWNTGRNTGRNDSKVESKTIRKTHKRKRGDGARRGRKRARKDASKAIGVPPT